MKLRNKKTGEVVEVLEIITLNNINYFRFKDNYGNYKKVFNSLKELNSEWEDYEEPKGIWWLDNEGNANHTSRVDNCCFKKNKQIGNYFKTKEEAEKAVEKLKAWQRLKDARIRFKDYHYELKDDDALITYELEIKADGFAYDCFPDDLSLLFGGEE